MCLCCGHDDMAANFAISLEPSETKSENFDTDNDNADAAVANLLLLMYREKKFNCNIELENDGRDDSGRSGMKKGGKETERERER